MQVLKNRQELLSWCSSVQGVGFVPTMGNLHDGHLSLVEAIRPHCKKILASIYVNPSQFSPSEDYVSYPRTLETDIHKLLALEVDAIFVPSDRDIYTDSVGKVAGQQGPLSEYASIASKAKRLCGVSRPHFFFGVVNVVKRLLDLVQPEVVCFGEKDFQQCKIIQEFCRHAFPTLEVICAPTKREQDGLAMSSRNVYLQEAERLIAPNLYQHLQDCQKQLLKAPQSEIAGMLANVWKSLEQSGFILDYFGLCDENDFLATTDLSQARLFAAVYLPSANKQVRLIDNLKI